MSELEPNYLAVSTNDPLATDPLLGGNTFPGSGFDNSPLPVGEELLNLYPPDKGDKLPGAVETILNAADPGDWLTPTFEDNQEADNPDGEKDTLTGVEKEPLEGGDTLLGGGDVASNTTSDRESEIAGDNSESDNSEANTAGEGDAATTASGDNTPTSDSLASDIPGEDKDKEVGDSASDSGNTLVNLSPEEEEAIYQRMQPFTGGVFTVGDTGEVGFDFLYDGGSYKGELAIFSLVGMGEYEPGSPEFIAEAARRASSNSPEGYIVISDPTEGARFNGLLNPYDIPRNQGEYKGVKTFAMTPGDEFGVILVPNGTIQEVVENPNVTGFKRPLFSMTMANPHEAFHVGQIADVTGDGHTYVLEDKRLDSGSDRDYDDFIFQVRGATSQTIHLSEVINPKKDWRQSEEGKALVDYANLSVQIVSGYIEAVKPELSEIVENAVESAENLDNYQAEDLKATQEWVIWINPAQNPDSLARLFGAENLGATGHIEDTYIWKFPKELTAAEVQKSLEDLIGSDFAYPLVPINLTKPQYLPKDPLVGDQWHLENTGQTGGTPGVDANILDALNLATGNGIVIGIVDDGVESGHIDLQDNFREDLSIDFNGTPQTEYPLDATPDVELESSWLRWFWQWYNRYYQPKTNTKSGWSSSVDPDQAQETSDPFQHGTAVAGIAAADNNGEGVSGVAPDAEIASVRLTADSVTEKQIADALAHEPQAIAIYNNSWKPEAPLLAAPLTLAALENGVKAGRDGKGNIYVFAGGNDGWLGENVNSNPFANSRYTIAVGAIDHNGTQAWYSEPGASLLVSAPSSSSVTDPLTGEKVSVGITTTDLQGEKGYNSGTEKTDSNTDKQNTATDLPQKTDSSTNQTDITNTNYTNRFGGTSAAAPIVSGVVALMLEANPDLTWRDVQHILVETATKNNPTDTDWVTNSGGYQVNQKYGFGTVNGAKAVQAAQTWTNVASEIAVKSGWQQVNQAIPDYDTVGLLGQQVADILSKNPTDVTEAEKAMLPALPPTNPQSVSAKMDIAEDINIEWVEVVFEAQHTARGDLKVTLVAPDGTESLLTDRHADPNNNYDKWTFTSNRHWGESSQGEWTLKVADEWGNEVGTWNGWKLNFYGTENPTVNIRATDNNATEDGSSGQYIVTRTGGNINKPLTVQYQIGGSATNGSDYTINGVTSTQTITFAPGQTTATIGINPIHDYEVEPSQNVQLSLVDAGGYHLGTDTAATVTITNSTTTERYGSFVYVNPANGHQYILSEPDTWLGAQNQAEALGGNLVAINDTAENQWLVDTFGRQNLWIGLTDSEIYGKQEGDFQWVNGESVAYTNWAPGEPNGHNINGVDFAHFWQDSPGGWADTYNEWQLLPGIIEIDPATITQPIVNVMVTDAIAGEDGNAGQIVIQRLGNLNQNLTINYTVAGDATNGSDYRGLSGHITIPAGETLATIPIIALPDDVIEANETVVVNLAAGDYQIGSKPSGHVIIADQNPINRIANEVIGRDVAFLAYWTQRWQNGETLAQLRTAIIQAGLNAQGSNQAETKIAEIYQDILGRAATSSEIASARSQLATGATLSELRQQLEGADIIDTSSYVYTNPATGNRYFLTKPDTWLGAQEQAQALGGNLVTIDDAAENQWLVNTFGGGRKLIGLNDSPIYGNTEGNHKWVSGEATYTNWWPTEPNNVLHTPEGEDFVEGDFPGSAWNDLPSQQNFLRPGIVEIPFTAPQPAPPPYFPTITVSNTNDNGIGSLRAALEWANGNPGKDMIQFHIPTTDANYNSSTGAFTIQPQSALPTITDAVIIDGTTQMGFAASPVIEIDGNNAGTSANGITINAGDSTVRGLAINRFNQSGILLQNNGDNTIEGNYIGTDVTGTQDLGNTNGVSVVNATNNTIGGTSPESRNLISGNNSYGISINGSLAQNNQVMGNYIGTNITGTQALGNNYGVYVSIAANNTIGGNSPESRNLISGNANYGVYINGSAAQNNQVMSNYIGTDVTGTQNLGNRWGVGVSNAPNNTIGGTSPESRNLISGNANYGVYINGSAAQNNQVMGNYIGTDVTGTQDLGNNSGVVVENSANNTIGGTDAESRNLISGNFTGVSIKGSTAQNNQVMGNYIGTDVTGTQDLGKGTGVWIPNAPNNTIGGTTPESRNLISGNSSGILIEGSAAQNNQVMGNYIGTDITGTQDLGNNTGVLLRKAPNNTIGGTTPESRNLISGNFTGVSINGSEAQNNKVMGNYIGTDITGTQDLGNILGVSVSNAPSNTIGGSNVESRNLISGNSVGVSISGSAAQNNQVMGNYIGTDVTGTQRLSNNTGVHIISSNNTIGGTTPESRNLISGNADYGVSIEGSGAQNNKVMGNYIGTDVTGTQDLGNYTGVYVLKAANNTIGGTTAQSRNLISGNTHYGVRIQGSEAQNNQVMGNYIGTDFTGTQNLGNGRSGAVLELAINNIIGGTVTGAGNIIAFNGISSNYGLPETGVDVLNASSGNAILGNSIFTNGGLGIDLSNYDLNYSNYGVTPNDLGDPDIGPNNGQNFPVLTAAASAGSNTTIQGMLNSTPNTTFRIEFFLNPDADAEGQTFLGFEEVTTDSNGDVNFSVNFTVGVPVGYYITATATDSANNTSEFSAPVTANSLPII